MKIINVKSTASPVILSGAGGVAIGGTNQSGVGFFFQTFGEFEKVTSIIEYDDTAGMISGYLVALKASIVSGNAVLIQGQKSSQASGGPVAVSGYAALVSGDLISNTVTILAYGE